VVTGPLLSVTPPPPRARWVRAVIVALVVGVLAGAAVLLQIRGWTALATESGGACGGRYGNDCPRGTLPVTVGSLVVGLVSVPLALRSLLRRPRVLSLLTAVAMVGGAFAGEQIFVWLHGADLGRRWSAPYDASDSLVTQGVWTLGSAVVRARVDEVVSYDGATGHQNWTFPLPGENTVCAMSAGTTGGVGVLGYHVGQAPCSHLVAVDLADGHQLWNSTVAAPPSNSSAGAEESDADPGSDAGPDAVAVSAGTVAAVLTDGVAGYDARTGARRWTRPAPAGCSTSQIAGGAHLVEVAFCDDGFDVVELDPATGAVRWQSTVADGMDDQVAVLSTDPVAINEIGPKPRLTNAVLVFGDDGHPGKPVVVSSASTPDGPVALDTGRHAFYASPVWWTFVDGGMVVGVTQETGGHQDVVAFRVADGRQQWVDTLSDDVSAVTDDGGHLLLVDDASPTPDLESIAVSDGSTSDVGLVPGDLSASDDTALYRTGSDFALVNSTGTNPTPPVAVVGG
jgi:hypothetical protein